MHEKANLVHCNANISPRCYWLKVLCICCLIHALFQLTHPILPPQLPKDFARLACACGFATQRLYSRYIAKHNTTLEYLKAINCLLSITFMPSVAVNDPLLDRELRRALTGTGPDRRRNPRTAPVPEDLGGKLYGRVV